MLTDADVGGISMLRRFSAAPHRTQLNILQMDVWCWLVILLAQATRGSRDVMVTLNMLRPVTQSADRFLAISISPLQLLNDAEYSVATVNMLQALAPGFLRMGGPESDSLAFRTTTNTSAAYLLTESHWQNINRLVADTGLQLIYSLGTKSLGQSELLRYSETRGYDVMWQLGYSTANNGTAEKNLKQVRQEVSNLHHLIDSFARYRNIAVLSPDVEFCEDSKCLENLKDFLLQAYDDVDIVVLKMKHQEYLKNIRRTFDKLEVLTNEIEKNSFSKGIVLLKTKNSFKKNIWLAEAEAIVPWSGLGEAMSRALHLGLASQLGYHTFLMTLNSPSQPSPGYWVAVLWRALVGRTLLGAKVWPQEAEAEVTVFGACTETRPNTALDLEWEYDPGAVTLWGVNTGAETTVFFRARPQQDHVHLYTLTYDGNGSVQMNGRYLRLVHGVMPRLSPRVRSTHSNSVRVSAQSVFFIVLPDAQVPICLNAEEKVSVPLKKEDRHPLALDIPLTPKAPSVSGKPAMKPNDILFEKGGMFGDTTEIKKGLTSGFEIKGKKDNVDRVEAIVTDVNKYTDDNLKLSEKTRSEKKDSSKSRLLSESAIEQNTSLLGKINQNLSPNPYNKHFSEDSKIYEWRNIMIDGENYTSSSSGISAKINESKLIPPIVIKDSANTTELNESSEVKRVKRSEYYDDFEQTENTETETSPLYRRVNLLRRILNRLQQSLQYENKEQNKNFQDFIGTVERLHNNEKIKPQKFGRKYSDYPEEMSIRRSNNDIAKEPAMMKNKNVENINYLPGEFYEILGDLKLDSNVSLKDKEEVMEASDTLQNKSETQKCKDEKSELSVFRKLENNPQEDKRLVEYATENSRQYFLVRNNSKVFNEKEEEIEEYEKKPVNNRQDKFVKIVSTEDIRGNKEENNFEPERFTEDQKEEENYKKPVKIRLTTNRSKRDTHIFKGDQSTVLYPHDEENQRESDYSDETELRRFLEDLTEEGEQLLQTIDEEYENNKRNSSNETGMKQVLTTESNPVLDKDKIFNEVRVLAKNSTEDSDFYIKNNILIDNYMKSDQKHPFIYEQTYDYNSMNNLDNQIRKNYERKNKTQFSTEQELISDSITSEKGSPSMVSEPIVSIAKTTLDNLDPPKRNISSKSITESINNSNMFLESILLQTDKTTKPGFDVKSNVKFNTSSDSLHSHKSDNGSKLSEIEVGGINKTSETIKDEVKYDVTVTSTSKPESEGIVPKTFTEILSEKEKSFDFKASNASNIRDRYFSNLTHASEELNKMELGDKLIHSGQQILNQLFQNKTIMSPNILDRDGTDQDIKIDSNRKIESKTLPPPPTPTLLSSRFPLPSILMVNRNLTLPKRIDIINNRISEFNIKHKLGAPILEKSFTASSDKYKERLEIIKLRLQKAKERLLNLTSPRATNLVQTFNPLRPKREIITNREMLNNLMNLGLENKADSQDQINLFDLKTKKPDGSLAESTLMKNLYLANRFKRQVPEQNEEEISFSIKDDQSYSPEQARVMKNKVDFSTGLNIDKTQPSANFSAYIPYYFAAIKKWVVPLSRDTENIFYKSKLFPVNLFGIVSDKWVQENVEGSSNSENERRRRALQYPCLRDRFNDFEAEDESSKLPWSSNVQNGKMASVRSANRAEPETTVTGVANTGKFPIRSRRAINQDIEMNEMEMKALLTNEVVKEKPTNDVSDSENVFSSILHKTLSKTVTNKTGIERMLELAKQYQETNPSSIEIFSQKHKNEKSTKFLKKIHDAKRINTTSTGATYDKDFENNTLEFRKNQTIITTSVTPQNDLFTEETEVEKSSSFENTSEVSKIKDIPKKDQKTPQDEWFDFIKNIEEFFDGVTTVIKKGIM